MNSRWTILAAAALLAFAAAPAAYCKYFPEPLAVVDPSYAASGSGFPAGMGASLEYGDYAFHVDYVDDFYFRLGSSPVFFASGDSFALGGNFESILMCSVVPPGDTAATIAQFWMNDVQFQYGLYASLALPVLPSWRPRLLAEYSRASEHPFIGRDYSQVATDILQLGLDFPELRRGAFALHYGLEGGCHHLFDQIWQSGLPQPRISWILEPDAEARYGLRGGISAVARVYPQVFIERNSGALAADLFAETGLDFEKGAARTELLLTFYGSGDSDILADQASPALRSGFAVRFSEGRGR